MRINKQIKNNFKLIFAPFLNKLGFIRKDKVLVQVVKPNYEKKDLLTAFFQTLLNIGFIPKHIVDVGANRGTWTREVIKIFPDAYYSLFEPQEHLQQSMKDLIQNPKVECYAVGVGKKGGDLKFTIVDRDDSCSFIYSETEARELGFEQITVPVVTLNDFFIENNKPFPDLIKIDAEGMDIEVLEGATHFLGKTEVVMVEASIVCKTYTNNIKTVISTMDDYGYLLFDVTDLNRPFSNKILWLTELVFVLKGGYIDSQKYN